MTAANASYDGDGRPTQTELEAAVAALFSPGIVVDVAEIALVDAALFAEELAYLSSAVTKRRAEFGTARISARRAMLGLGVHAGALVPHSDRSPHWPPGIVGSISHTDRWSVVAVARASDVTTLGLDLEPERRLDPAVIEAVCTSAERVALNRDGRGDDDAVILFAAKEAFYKAQYPITRTFLAFEAVAIDLDRAAGRFEARTTGRATALPEAFDRVQGAYCRTAGIVACAVEIPARR